MLARRTDSLLHEIDDIVRVVEALARDAASSDDGLGPDRIEELRSAVTRLGHLFRGLLGAGCQHLDDLERIQSTNSFASMHSNWFQHVAQLSGLAKALQHQLRTGLLHDVRSLVHAEVFDDFLEMSEHLLHAGYKDPAAVLVGAVLEDALWKRAAREGIALLDGKGKKLTIEPLNAALARASVYNALVQKHVSAWADLRNKAAHGHSGEYDTGQVAQMLAGVRKFCSDYGV